VTHRGLFEQSFQAMRPVWRGTLLESTCWANKASSAAPEIVWALDARQMGTIGVINSYLHPVLSGRQNTEGMPG